MEMNKSTSSFFQVWEEEMENVSFFVSFLIDLDLSDSLDLLLIISATIIKAHYVSKTNKKNNNKIIMTPIQLHQKSLLKATTPYLILTTTF